MKSLCAVVAMLTLGLAGGTLPARAQTEWTGSYVGLSLGGRTLDVDWDSTQAFAPVSGFLAPIPFSTDPSESFEDTTFRIGGFAGYNWQFAGNWVGGVEGDFGWAEADEQFDRIPGIGIAGVGSTTDIDVDWDASARARLGYLVSPSVLVYATGGIAIQQLDVTMTCPADTTVCNPGLGTQIVNQDFTQVGWTLGAGAEMLMGGHFLLRFDYRFADFGSEDVTFPPVNGQQFGIKAELESQSHTFAVGLGYKF